MASTSYVDFARFQGSEKLLMKLSHGKVASCPFSDQSIAALKRQVVSDLEQVGLHLSRNTQDRRDVSIDNRVEHGRLLGFGHCRNPGRNGISWSRANPWTLLKENRSARLDDQTARGQLLKMTETEARTRFPGLVVASLESLQKDKPNGVVTKAGLL